MRSRVSSPMSDWPFRDLLTVATDTPHSRAMSFMETTTVIPFLLNRLSDLKIAHIAQKIKMFRHKT